MGDIEFLAEGPVKIPSYEDIFASLPLEGCIVTKNSLLASYEAENETEYIAPAGQAFMLGGSFLEQSEASDFERGYIHPIESRQYFIDEHKAEIEKYQASGISMAQALELFMTDYCNNDDITWREPFIPPEVFIGRTLAIRGNSLQIVVKGPVEADAEAGVKVIKLPTGNGSERSTGMSIPDSNIWWQRQIAIGIFGECAVELVPYDEPEPELWLPKERTKELFVAGSSNPYSDLMDEYGGFAGTWMAVEIEASIRDDELHPEQKADADKMAF